MCHDGVKLDGSVFLITEAEAEVLGYLRREGIADHIRPYRNGRDLAARGRNLRVIDLYGLSEDQTRRALPELYKHLLQTVGVSRRQQFDKSPTAYPGPYLENEWLLGTATRKSVVEGKGVSYS